MEQYIFNCRLNKWLVSRLQEGFIAYTKFYFTSVHVAANGIILFFFFIAEWLHHGFPWWPGGKECICQAGDMGLIPGSGRTPGEGNGSPLQYYCLGNPMESSLEGYSPWGWKTVGRGLATKQQGQQFHYTYVPHLYLLLCWWIFHFAVQQKLTQHCKSTIL